MAYQSVFERREMKYLLTQEQYEDVREAMEGRMRPDRFPVSQIRNIYYDTSDHIIAIRNNSRPYFKEKLRVRKYSGDGSAPAFVEIKTKVDQITYKRRLALPEQDALRWLAGDDAVGGVDSQIGREIAAFRDRYSTLAPSVKLCYHRESFRPVGDEDLRMTFDRSITATLDDLDLGGGMDGTPLIPDGCCMMELKTGTAVPLWLVEVLSRDSLYVRSFSKYGYAYRKLITGQGWTRRGFIRTLQRMERRSISDGARMWWARPDLNRRPSGYEPDALPAKLRARWDTHIRTD